MTDRARKLGPKDESLVRKLRLEPGKKVRLRDEDAGRRFGWEENAARAATATLRGQLEALQHKLYADGRFALLVVLQELVDFWSHIAEETDDFVSTEPVLGGFYADDMIGSAVVGLHLLQAVLVGIVDVGFDAIGKAGIERKRECPSPPSDMMHVDTIGTQVRVLHLGNSKDTGAVDRIIQARGTRQHRNSPDQSPSSSATSSAKL